MFPSSSGELQANIRDGRCQDGGGFGRLHLPPFPSLALSFMYMCLRTMLFVCKSVSAAQTAPAKWGVSKETNESEPCNITIRCEDAETSRCLQRRHLHHDFVIHQNVPSARQLAALSIYRFLRFDFLTKDFLFFMLRKVFYYSHTREDSEMESQTVEYNQKRCCWIQPLVISSFRLNIKHYSFLLN